jgi:Fe-S-cluster containining protein
MAWSDVLTGREEAESERRGEPVTCGKGCAACCRELVPVSPAEAFALREALDSMLPEAAAAREARFREAIDRLRSAIAEDPGLMQDPARYFGLYLDCPFLDDEACAIHAGRPLACREHLAVSPASHCRSFPNHAIRMLGLSHPAGEALSRACGELLGTAPERIPLVAALAWADVHPDEGMREWPAETVAGALASQLFSG